MAGQRFSERHGLAPEEAEITIRGEAPEELRGIVVDFAYDCALRPHSVRKIVCRVLMRLPDEDNWSAFPNVDNETRGLLQECEWFEVYDAIEAINEYLHGRENEPSGAYASAEPEDVHYAQLINTYFRRRGFGYQLIDGKVEIRGPEAFEVAVRTAHSKLQEANLTTAAKEMHEALHDLSRRPKPDATGAIQHAMAAAECVARTAANDQKATLGDILKKHSDLIPRPLDDALSKMWGYASEMARHLREGREPSPEEAELAVITAAGVVTYLERKLQQRER